VGWRFAFGGQRFGRQEELERYSEEAHELVSLGGRSRCGRWHRSVTALWIDVSRGTHTDDRRGAAGATLLAWCMGIATVLGIIGLVVKFW
jgi:hypothetical protein